MKLVSRLASTTLFSGIALAAACAPTANKGGAPPASPTAQGDSETAAATPPGSPIRKHAARQAYPERRPPAVTAPRKGDPGASALAEARLVKTTCDKVSADQIEAQLKEMRAAVDESFKEWHDAQPGCWEEDRERWRWQQEMMQPRYRAAAKPSASGSMWGGAIGDSFGAGGLGLSGVGQGGGGRGEGVGLGSIGTVTKVAEDKKKDVKGATSMSGTNNQVATVDEADFVKTDGKYVYFAANGALRIAEAMNPKMVSTTRFPGVARELFVEGDRAVVYASNGNPAPRCTYGYDCTFAGDGTSTSVLVYDLANRAAPKLVRQIDLSGSLVAARRIGNAVHTVVADNDTPAPPYETWPADFEMCGTAESVVRAKFGKLKADNERRIRSKTSAFPTIKEGGKDRVICDGGLYRTALKDGQAFTTVASFDLKDDKAQATTATVQSRPGAVFASANGLYLSVVHHKQDTAGRWYNAYASADEASEIHKFKIGSDPKETRYQGSGLVPGHVLNQFAMDEWYGYLRVATTKGRVPDPKVESVVSVLAEVDGGNLVRVGAIEHIAPGEDIRSVRFDDDRGYIVTFKKTDPLFVVDLFQPSAPRILGELKIPGFSTYMHRIDPDHLLSIGFDANDHGDFAYFDGVILQLFDVKNPTDPRLVHKEKIGTRGSSSAAATDHLAFNYFADRGLLAVPMTICQGGGDGVNGDKLAFSGLLVYDVDVEAGFKRLGGVNHGKAGADCGTWWSSATSAVKRSIFLDDLVYSIAPEKAKVQDMKRFGVDLADLSLTQ